jgi:glycogen debranching enzyme
MLQPRTRQPMLHELVVTLAAPTMLLSASDGGVGAVGFGAVGFGPGGGGSGAQGLFHADLRALSLIHLTVSGEVPDPVLAAATGSGTSRLVGLARNLGDAVPDPTVRVDRVRRVTPGRLSEELVVTSTATSPVTAVVRIDLGSDLLPLGRVKAGLAGPAIIPRRLEDGRLEWSAGATRVLVSIAGASVARDDGTTGVAGTTGLLEWTLYLRPGRRATVNWQVQVDDTDDTVGPAPSIATWSVPEVTADDRRLAAWVDQSLKDAHSLRLSLPDRPDDVFLAAGAPWFLTLFGRDSLWAARMLLPIGTDLARGTLRALARRQGTHPDPACEMEPGKILHELRRGTFDDAMGLRLPPVYYGSVDATPLWVCLLHDAWRWGMASADVEPLLPHLVRALDWIAAAAAAGDGFLAYIDHTGSGLTNQGWKDSADSVRYRDGSLAAPPVALAEVQGYAHEAARAGAELLEAFDLPGADRWRGWADDLAARFRSSYWTGDDRGPYPAMALDGAGQVVDAIASNMAHLLGTGLLDQAETDLVVDRITSPGLADGYGLRTMSGTARGYSALSYHCGSVWPHDTAIAVSGLARTGNAHRAGELIEGLLSASFAFHGRLPELWGGDPRSLVPAPVPYPAACRPQAWAAASAVSLLASMLGIGADAPAGTLTLTPAVPSPVGALKVSGLHLAGHRLDITIDAAGTLTSVVSEAAIAVITRAAAEVAGAHQPS